MVVAERETIWDLVHVRSVWRNATARVRGVTWEDKDIIRDLTDRAEEAIDASGSSIDC